MLVVLVLVVVVVVTVRVVVVAAMAGLILLPDLLLQRHLVVLAVNLSIPYSIASL